MDVKLDSTDMNEKMGDGSEGKSKFHDSLTTASKLPIIPDNSIAGPTGMFTEKRVYYNQYISNQYLK